MGWGRMLVVWITVIRSVLQPASGACPCPDPHAPTAPVSHPLVTSTRPCALSRFPRGLEVTYDEFLEMLVRLAHTARPLGENVSVAGQLEHLLLNEAVGLLPASERVIGLWQALEKLPTYSNADY